MESREFRALADYLEKLCVVSHRDRTQSVACDECRSKAFQLRAYAAALDQAARPGGKAIAAIAS
jgi:hypothetical protein